MDIVMLWIPVEESNEKLTPSAAISESTPCPSSTVIGTQFRPASSQSPRVRMEPTSSWVEKSKHTIMKLTSQPLSSFIEQYSAVKSWHSWLSGPDEHSSTAHGLAELSQSNGQLSLIPSPLISPSTCTPMSESKPEPKSKPGIPSVGLPAIIAWTMSRTEPSASLVWVLLETVSAIIPLASECMLTTCPTWVTV